MADQSSIQQQSEDSAFGDKPLNEMSGATYRELLKIWVTKRGLQITPGDAHIWKQIEEPLGSLVRLEREGY